MIKVGIIEWYYNSKMNREMQNKKNKKITDCYIKGKIK